MTYITDCLCVCLFTCLFKTGCCNPSKRRRTPSYLASSPMHFPKKSEETQLLKFCLAEGGNVKMTNTGGMVTEYLEYRSSSPQTSSSPSSACLEVSGGDCSRRKLCLEGQRSHEPSGGTVWHKHPLILSAVYLSAGWWGKLAGAPAPPGSVCTAGSNQCRLPACSWTGSCRSLTDGAASQGYGRQLGLTTKKVDKSRQWIGSHTRKGVTLQLQATSRSFTHYQTYPHTLGSHTPRQQWSFPWSSSDCASSRTCPSGWRCFWRGHWRARRQGRTFIFKMKDLPTLTSINNWSQIVRLAAVYYSTQTRDLFCQCGNSQFDGKKCFR